MISFTPRKTCLWIHRYTGLLMAVFLIVAGITGTLLAFYDELDDVFNRHLVVIEPQSTPPKSIAELHDIVITAYPMQQFSSMPTAIESGKSVAFSVDRVRGEAAKNRPKPRFQEVYINPFTGDIIGTRDKNEWAWRNSMYKVFWLHRELLLGDIGRLALGVIALIWTLNCFIGFYLTFPRALKNGKTKSRASQKKRASFIKRWQPAWKIRTKTNTFKLNYDLHHAFGLWLWVILFVIAWSSVGFNLPQVYRPVMNTVFNEAAEDSSRRAQATLAPTRDAVDNDLTINVTPDRVDKYNSIAYLSEQADIAAQKNGVKVVQLLGIRWMEEEHQWQMRFKTDRDIGKKGGASSITINAAMGAVESVHFGYQSSAGSKANQWLTTLHMGHIGQGVAHVAYQVFLAFVGLAVMILSGTGVYLWYKGRQQRLKTAQKKQAKPQTKPYPQSLDDPHDVAL